MKYLIFLWPCVCVLVACSAEMHDGAAQVRFTEEPGGTCGEHEPIVDLADACDEYGGVFLASDNPEAFTEFNCTDGSPTGLDAHIYWHNLGKWGAFDVFLPECHSNYKLSIEPS